MDVAALLMLDFTAYGLTVKESKLLRTYNRLTMLTA